MSIRKRRASRMPKSVKKLLKLLKPSSKKTFKRFLRASKQKNSIHKVKEASHERIQGTVKVVNKQEKPIIQKKPDALLNETLALQLCPHLPYTYRRQAWEIMFCTGTDGYNLRTAYTRYAERKVERRGTQGCVILVKTTGGEIFGAFTSSPLKADSSNIGNGECFVFKTQPVFECFQASDVNHNYVSFTNEYLSFGGGGAMALYVDDALEHGLSSESVTYGSKPLCSEPSFKCSKVEIWTFKSPFALSFGS